MFSSHYTHTLDSQGRLPVPPGWRKQLGPAIVVTRGLDSCLFVFSLPRFERLARDIERLGLGRSDARALSRYFFEEAIDHPLDRRGRLSLTPSLLGFAGIQAEALLVGANDRIEIWNPGRFAEFDQALSARVNDVAERVGADLQRAEEELRGQTSARVQAVRERRGRKRERRNRRKRT